jgi:hypothetical protein
MPQHHVRYAADSISISDAATAYVSSVRHVADSVEISDAATAHVSPMVELGPIEVHASASLEFTVLRQEGRSVPDVEIGVDKNAWEIGTTGFGLGLGSVIGHLPGALIGAVVFYVWGRWRWRETNR